MWWLYQSIYISVASRKLLWHIVVGLFDVHSDTILKYFIWCHPFYVSCSILIVNYPCVSLTLHVDLTLFAITCGGGQCSRLKSPMPFKCTLALQNIPLSKQPFQTQPQIENEDVTWSPWYNMPATRTNERRALSIQEVELDGWFLILHIVLETCTM